jgi:hypothetical protein
MSLTDKILKSDDQKIKFNATMFSIITYNAKGKLNPSPL